jgi:hypothetical protein
MAKRRWPRPTCGPIHIPSPSGPRWASDAFIICNNAVALSVSIEPQYPAIPHISITPRRARPRCGYPGLQPKRPQSIRAPREGCSCHAGACRRFPGNASDTQYTGATATGHHQGDRWCGYATAGWAVIMAGMIGVSGDAPNLTNFRSQWQRRNRFSDYDTAPESVFPSAAAHPAERVRSLAP